MAMIDGDQDLTLSKEEAKTLKLIANREAILRELAAAVKGLEVINKVAGLVVTGPVKLAISWNSIAISGWKTANGHLGKIAESVTCSDIDFMLIEVASGSANETFWKNMRDLHGCR